jgi:hypothetical protein
MKKSIFLLLLFVLTIYARGQKTSIKEEMVLLPTYPFSDPDPVAKPGKIYPYFRFDGYSLSPIQIRHKMVVMENQWIKLWIAPDMGGKIYGAMDKKTDKYFIYFNNVVKFRDIAMRGPWTSGGIEFNFGIIGHAPTTATPVDYRFQYNDDGSVSCFVGTLELTSRTEWRVEIRLPADKAWFETKSYWNNPTQLKTSLYHWQTAAADVGEDFQYYFPGKAYIGHSGEESDWPVTNDGRDISMYKNNNYGASHSYHVLGEYTDWFAGYYHDSDFGFGHWSRYPYKPGKKIWIWALSREGAIWENLLTDTDKGNKQYTEIQTGLLFNQEADGSTYSPFKHLYLLPGAVENFKERWFPISGTKGVKSASEEGVLNIIKNGDGFDLKFQSLAYVNDILQVTDTLGKIIFEYPIVLAPQELFEKTIGVNPETVIIRLRDGDLFADLTSKNKNVLDRPLEMPGDFDWESTYGLYVRGIEKARQRLYDQAKTLFEKCLAKDKDYIPALTGLAEIDLRQMKYDDAERKLMKVISFDTYDPDANFLYGTILMKKKEYSKAKDAFGVTLRTPEYKASSLNQLAIIALKEKRLEEAWEYIINAGIFNGMDLNIYKTACVIARLRKDTGNYNLFLNRLHGIDPLSHFAAFEKYYSKGDSLSKTGFLNNLNNEFKYETFIELSLWYHNAGLENEALAVIELCPENPLADYLAAYLEDIKNDKDKSKFYLERALKASSERVFPYRDEYAPVLKWADQKQPHWKTKYYFGLLYWSREQYDIAAKYFDECGSEPDTYIFYLARAGFRRQAGIKEVEADYLNALNHNGRNWRTFHILHGYYISENEYDKAKSISAEAIKLQGSIYITSFDHALSLFYTSDYEGCLKILENIKILPYEGAGYGRTLWRNANIMNALKCYSSNRISRAVILAGQAYKWPENLGVGRPYKVDERIEDFVMAMILDKSGKKSEANALYKKVAEYSNGSRSGASSVNYLSYLALRKTSGTSVADEYLNKWLSASSNSSLKDWARYMSQNQKEKALEAIRAMITADDKKQPWNPRGTDDNFRIINDITLLYLTSSK